MPLVRHYSRHFLCITPLILIKPTWALSCRCYNYAHFIDERNWGTDINDYDNINNHKSAYYVADVVLSALHTHDLLESSWKFYKEGLWVLHGLYMGKKLRFKAVKWLAHGHPARERGAGVWPQATWLEANPVTQPWRQMEGGQDAPQRPHRDKATSTGGNLNFNGSKVRKKKPSVP